MALPNLQQNVPARAPHGGSDGPGARADGSPRSPADSTADPRGTDTRGADPRTDEQLLLAHRDGEPDVFRRLVDRYQRELYHFLVRFLGDKTVAEDIFQEAFLQVHQSANQFDASRRFKPWLFTIAANKGRDFLRAQSRRPVSSFQTAIGNGEEDGNDFLSLMASADELPSLPLEREELCAKVQAVVQGMPVNLREVLLLSYFHEFPYKHIADMLGIPLGTVKSRLHAAVANFAGRWRRANPPSSAS